MATPASLLQQVENAIEFLLIALADEATQEYTYNGRTWKRADFSKALDSLMATRLRLQQEVSRSSRRQIRLGSLGPL